MREVVLVAYGKALTEAVGALGAGSRINRGLEQARRLLLRRHVRGSAAVALDAACVGLAAELRRIAGTPMPESVAALLGASSPTFPELASGRRELVRLRAEGPAPLVVVPPRSAESRCLHRVGLSAEAVLRFW